MKKNLLGETSMKGTLLGRENLSGKMMKWSNTVDVNTLLNYRSDLQFNCSISMDRDDCKWSLKLRSKLIYSFGYSTGLST